MTEDENINWISKFITGDPDIFNEGWEELGIQDPGFEDPEPNLTPNDSGVDEAMGFFNGEEADDDPDPPQVDEDLKILETAALFANLQGLDWDELPREQRVKFFQEAQQWHLEHGFD